MKSEVVEIKEVEREYSVAILTATGRMIVNDVFISCFWTVSPKRFFQKMEAYIGLLYMYYGLFDWREEQNEDIPLIKVYNKYIYRSKFLNINVGNIP